MSQPTPAAGNAAVAPPEVRPLLQVRDLAVDFKVPTKGSLRAASLRAVAGVNLDAMRGEILGVVGESGCGKSTTGRAILQLLKPSQGTVTFDGVELTTLPRGRMRAMRRRMQMIFQDPYASLNPRMTIGELIEEPLLVHSGATARERRARALETMDLVGLNARWHERYPHELSGGQRQRVGIARALVSNPDFIVADEPVSALDVSIQAQIVNLLESLQEDLGLTILFIAHDLAVVRHLCDRIAVMYLGTVVEIGDCETLYNQPQHPYTQALLSAVPIPDPLVETERRRRILVGDVPSPLSPPSGCRFRTRCWKAQEICATETPTLTSRNSGHQAACHFPETSAPAPQPTPADR
ncbi:peptide/nickel transport system ATP-binding protein/oligopeptide transport system ATP-binding protein [Sinosporangium album]|uniref:Peptide/nickel transport system ATP-binding protein/oligopeptide transport system ATP-binding protein n=1 Tax=Sinosporangium album TaxID=504805 RepID=A0A1G7QQ05_9ACTN|nr:oligopeptide/dipeptide ABC transporter ATP-binding protein [Sinosporangium album]SDG00582.1 peptide/nickel transport system ATP-binding protein/oligopeptide transport system ATP-binding protein [Sinosporangium album]